MGYRQLSYGGGTVEYLVDGPRDAPDLLLFHQGTPCAAVRFPSLIRAAAAAGMRTAVYSRAGFGHSTRRPGRIIGDEAALSAAIADALGVDRFFTAGWSGGGTVALACAALLPERVRACLTLGSLAPRHEVGGEWRTWFRSADLAEWDILASDDQTVLVPDFEAAVGTFGARTARTFAEDSRANDADRAAILGPDDLGSMAARAMRRGVSRGYHGFLDDNIAEAHDWGFRVGEIRVPVVIRHGEGDRYVNVAHGRWLAAAIPGARGIFPPGAGHFSIMLPLEQVVGELVAAAS